MDIVSISRSIYEGEYFEAVRNDRCGRLMVFLEEMGLEIHHTNEDPSLIFCVTGIRVNVMIKPRILVNVSLRKSSGVLFKCGQVRVGHARSKEGYCV